MAKDLEAAVGDFVESLDHRALTGEVLEPLKRAVLDCLASILSGTTEPVCLRLVEHVNRTARDGPATMIGHESRTTVEGAALVNGTMGHACDYDDVCLTMWGHATAPVLPAALAISELNDLSGREFLVAFLAGLELEARLGAVAAPVHYEAGWHPTSTIGVLGAAVAAAKALGLDSDGVQRALGIAASRSAGLRENFGTMMKPLHVGFAARDGVEAALLARAGVTASRHALDGTYGFLNVFAPGHRPADDLAERLGNPFDIVDPGLAFKMYPSCSDTHPSVDAALALRRRHDLDPGAIARVRAGVTPLVASNLTHHEPSTSAESKFSLEFCVATALVRGRLGLSEFEPGVVDDPLIQDLMGRVEVWLDPDLPVGEEVSFCSPASIEIETAGGQNYRAVETCGRGHPDKPMTDDDLAAKFGECAQTALAPEAARRVLELVSHLETVSSVRGLTKELRGRAEPVSAVAQG